MSQENVEIAQRIYEILAEQGVNEQAFLAMIERSENGASPYGGRLT